jgi:hypothetical protein
MTKVEQLEWFARPGCSSSYANTGFGPQYIVYSSGGMTHSPPSPPKDRHMTTNEELAVTSYSEEDKRKLQALAGIPNLPTDLTYEARIAMSGEGPRAYDWIDKPHRLVFDLCREIERLRAADREMMSAALTTTLTPSPTNDPLHAPSPSRSADPRRHRASHLGRG